MTNEDVMMQEWEEESEQTDRFTVVDDGGAGWCLRQMLAADEECDKLIDWYKSQIEIVKARRDAKKERMKTYLREYSETVPMHESATQYSYPIPGGKLVLKKAHDVLTHDDEKIIAALKEQGRSEYIKITEKLDWDGLKKELKQTGEVIDGIGLEHVDDTFVVTFDRKTKGD